MAVWNSVEAFFKESLFNKIVFIYNRKGYLNFEMDGYRQTSIVIADT